MGVKGLWKLLQSTGQPITLESLEGKVLAIDISLWLNMAVKGMRDVHGYASNDAHLVTLFNRICKLLYFGVKPVFVFDGQAPLLKHNTLQERNEKRRVHTERGQAASQKLLQNYLKRQVLEMATSINEDRAGDSNADTGAKQKQAKSSSTKSLSEIKRVKKNEEDDLYNLPAIKENYLALNSSDDEREEQWIKRSSTREAVYGNAMLGDFRQMMSIDVDSEDFKTLPSDIQHELLTDIKEIRKRRRTQFETMPENSKLFSSYQLEGLLAKRGIADRIEQIEKRIQQDNAMSMSALGLEGDAYESESVIANQLISDENTRYILINKLTKKKNREQDAGSISSKIEEKKVLVKPVEKNQSYSTDEVDSKGQNVVNISEEEIVSSSEEISDFDRESFAEVTPKIADLQYNSAPTTSLEISNIPSKSVVKSNDDVANDLDDDSVSKSNFNSISLFPTESVNESELDTSLKNNTSSLQDTDRSPSNLIKKDLFSSEDMSAINEEEIKNEESDDEFVEVEECTSNTINLKADKTETGVDAQHDIPNKDFIDIIDKEAISTQTESDASILEVNPWKTLLEEDDVSTIHEKLDKEDIALIEKMKSSSRAARDLSDVATSETQELLKLFGIPFLISPQEAESQCAYLDQRGLTMGTITDDSDVLLFGGRVVYKSIFDRKHDPSMYSISMIKAELGLEREHLINIALCSGSDYTVGIESVGPVAALEIMKEFPGKGVESLHELRRWWDEAQTQVKISPSETKIKGRLRKLSLPHDFPSQFVVEAYLNPVIDQSTNGFSWGIPDLDAIRNFLMERLSWKKSRIDEMLLPVLKRTAERKNQTSLTQYFSRSIPLPRSSKKRSKRVNRAIFGIARSDDTKSSKKQNSKKRSRVTSVHSATKSQQTVFKKNKVCLSESSSSESS